MRVLSRIIYTNRYSVGRDRHHHAPDPVAAADPHLHLAADLLAFLRHRGARFLLELRARPHHLRRRPGEGVVLPGAGVDVAARPAVHAEAVAAVVAESAFVALARPLAAAPRIGAHALLA